VREFTARNPRTGDHDWRGQALDPAEVAEVAARLRAAQVAWEGRGAASRLEVLRAFGQSLRRHAEPIGAALEADTGRRRIARLEIDSVIGSIEAWARVIAADVAPQWIQGRGLPSARHTAAWKAYPLVGVVSPWNFPLLLGMIDAVPALLAGCAVLVKPSEVTPRFIAPVMAAVAEVPELAAVFAIVPGDGATGQAVVDVADCVCFTGSVATGRKVAVQAAHRLIPAYLELGGKDPLIVLEGADLEAATDAALRGSVLSTGQACQSIERIYVARPIHDAFLARLVEKARAARLNWPDITAGEIGPIIFDRQADILSAQIADAREKGARVLTGGEIETHGGGRWLRPTVLSGVTPDMAVLRDETFGPILPVVAFDSIDEAVALANDGEYGLSGAVFAATLEEAEAVGRRLEAGAISLNDAALTSIFYEAAKQGFKASGLGPSRMGEDGYRRFLRRQALIANTARPLPLAAFSEEGST
jgi:succinate-semialdehyde dehydrogenase / glutarate-semialdehyde dehydrogenase